MAEPDPIWVDVVLVRETDKAYLFQIEDEEIWVPKSCVHAKRKNKQGQIERCEISAWFAKKSGIDE